MSVSAIASLATQMSQQRAAYSVDTAILKKALDVQQANAMTLIQSVTPASALPSHLGQNVNVIA